MRWRMTACCPRPWSSSFNRDEPVVPRWLIPAAVAAANVERPNSAIQECLPRSAGSWRCTASAIRCHVVNRLLNLALTQF
jgi:hypothetical protein